MAEPSLDEVGGWTEIKLDILSNYSAAYATILRKQTAIRHYAYIDGFAGPGRHISKRTGEVINGSPLLALNYPFSHYYFVEKVEDFAAHLSELTAGRPNVTVYSGDCNKILLDKVFPNCLWDDYRRALCVLDPSDLNPKWEVIQTAGRMRSIEIFVNFMIMDANRNVLWPNPDRVPQDQIVRMNAVWGDESWREAAYKRTWGLFGDISEKARSEAVVGAYRKRLREVAGFKYVPEPIPMRNTRGAVVYYLFFASHNKIGDKIARSLFKKYRDMGAEYAREVQD